MVPKTMTERADGITWRTSDLPLGSAPQVLHLAAMAGVEPFPEKSELGQGRGRSDAAKVEARRGRLPLYVRRGQALLGC